MRSFGYIILLVTGLCYGQNWEKQELGSLPFKTSNNAVALATKGDTPMVFSFSGIGEQLNYQAIHLKSGGFNTITQKGFNLPNVPDTVGKIAAAASTVNNIIYVMGGYHVFEGGSEISSNKNHRFDPETLAWLSDGANIPVPIDDHVQAVWNDSLIFLISGWSNTTNVTNVQVYNPTTDTWKEGSALPNLTEYGCFGASGTIIGNTIYYLGGARMGLGFPITWRLRIGEINPNDPTDISWSSQNLTSDQRFYRSVCANISDYPLWFGGSKITYNYDGIAYQSGNFVQQGNTSFLWDEEGTNYTTESLDLPMDLRGLAQLSATEVILAGGMYLNQQVSNKVVKLTWGFPADVESSAINPTRVYPNPATTYLKTEGSELAQVFSSSGILILETTETQIDVRSLSSGMYILKLKADDTWHHHRFIKTD